MNIRAHWEAELRAGVNGQDRNSPATWTMDGLYFAACYETNASEYDAEAKRCRDRFDRYGADIWRRAAAEERQKALAALAKTLDVAA
jgi:hypothetical protein